MNTGLIIIVICTYVNRIHRLCLFLQLIINDSDDERKIKKAVERKATMAAKK